MKLALLFLAGLLAGATVAACAGDDSAGEPATCPPVAEDLIRVGSGTYGIVDDDGPYPDAGAAAPDGGLATEPYVLEVDPARTRVTETYRYRGVDFVVEYSAVPEVERF